MSEADWMDRLSESIRKHETDRREGPASHPRYRILGELSRGGMGVVYRALDPQLGREVALKVLLEQGEGTAEGRERFARESQLAARLHHPNIVPVYDTGEHEGRAFLAMQLVDGTTLEKARPELRAALAAVRDAARALDYAHGQGVIHRDVKPSNLMLDRQGRVYVTDFGVARAAGIAAHLTLPGTVIGTAAYMSPEQARGTDVDARSDVYALGATLYELATGRAPFEGPGRREVLEAVMSKDPPLPRSLKPDLSQNVEAILLKAMDRDPRDRYATAADLADDIDRYLRGDRPLARPRGPFYRARRELFRHPVRSAATALLVALLAAGLVLLGYYIRAVQAYRAAMAEPDLPRKKALLETAVAFVPEARPELEDVIRRLVPKPLPAPLSKDRARLNELEQSLKEGNTEKARELFRQLEADRYPGTEELLKRIRSKEFEVGISTLEAFAASGSAEQFSELYTTLRGPEYSTLVEEAGLATLALSMGMRLAQGHSLAEAIRWLDEAESLGSAQRELFETRGRVRIARKEWEAAEKDYLQSESKRLVTQPRNPGFSTLFRHKASEAMSRRAWMEALDFLKTAIEINPGDSNALHDHGLARFRALSQPLPALEELRAALKLDPALTPSREYAEIALEAARTRPEAWKLENAAARQAAWKEAVAGLDLALERVAPGDPALLLERARLKRRMGDFAGSVLDATNAGDAEEAFLLRGQGEFGSAGADAIPSALKSFESEAARNPRSGAARYWKGVCLQALGKAAEAKDEFLAAVSLGFDGPDLHLRLAAIALEQKAWADVPGRAARVHESAEGVSEDELFARQKGAASRTAEIRRLRRDAHYVTARARFEARDYDRAIEECDRALQQDSSFPEAHFRKGYALYWLRRHDEAMKAFGNAIALRPDDAAPYVGRATILAELSRFNEALSDYEAALRLEPGNYSALAGRGLARAARNDIPGAREDIRKAIELAPAGWPHRETLMKKLSEFR